VPTFAHSALVPRSDDSGPVCKPVVQISFRNLNFFLDALRLEVSPCAITTLQQGGDITLQADKTISDGSITDQALKTVTPAIQQGLLWRMNDILQVQQSCPAHSISISNTFFNDPALGPISEVAAALWSMIPSVHIGPFQSHIPFTCQS
jgi:hypothetical protein